MANNALITSSPNDSVSLLIDEIKVGNDRAAEELWKRYFPRLVDIARRKLANERDPMIDGEDVALSVLNSFFEAAQDERFPDLNDRDGLWSLLAAMTYRKVYDAIRYSNRDKRKGLHESDIGIARSESGAMQRPMEGLDGGEPTPDWTLIMKETVEEMLARLDDPQRETIALLRLDGYSNREIGERIHRSVPNVELKLRIIRKIWEDYVRPRPDDRPRNA